MDYCSSVRLRLQRVSYFDTPVRLDRLNSRYLLTVRILAHLDQHLPIPSQCPVHTHIVIFVCMGC